MFFFFCQNTIHSRKNMPLSTIFLLDFLTVPTVQYFFTCFSLYKLYIVYNIYRMWNRKQAKRLCKSIPIICCFFSYILYFRPHGHRNVQSIFIFLIRYNNYEDQQSYFFTYKCHFTLYGIVLFLFVNYVERYDGLSIFFFLFCKGIILFLFVSYIERYDDLVGVKVNNRIC